MLASNRSRRIATGALISTLILVTTVVVSIIHYRYLSTISGTINASDALKGTVSVLRDSDGVPTINASSRLDAAYATGFVHAQDRFFQMDLLRRSAAGELSSLIGPPAVAADTFRRQFLFRKQAKATLAKLPSYQQDLLKSYARGVNAGLAKLGRPIEYAALRIEPSKWEEEDSLLVVWAMYLDLQAAQIPRMQAVAWIRDDTTKEQASFLLPRWTPYDSPLDASPSELKDSINAVVPPDVPTWFQIDSTHTISATSPPAIGSNNFAVAGSRTKTGASIVGADMHLRLSLPNVWYRTAVNIEDKHNSSQTTHLVGLTLPGAPLFVVGSNQHVAWSFTNSNGLFVDLLPLKPSQDNSLEFFSVHGTIHANSEHQQIDVRGTQPVSVDVLRSESGPIIKLGKQYSIVHWIATETGAVNMAFVNMENAMTVADAITIGNTSGMPALNMIVGDSSGSIGWTIAGAIPNRSGIADSETTAWHGVLSSSEYPKIVNPPSGILSTANNRILLNDRVIGDGGADLGARATQLHDDVSALTNADESKAYEVLNDDRALFMEKWRTLALEALTDASIETYPTRAIYRNLLRTQWDGRASVNSTGYLLTRVFVDSIYTELFGSIDAQLKAEGIAATYALANPKWPYVALLLLQARNDPWLPYGVTSQEIILKAIDSAAARLTKDGKKLEELTWGNWNRSDIGHPFANIAPILRSLLSAPSKPQSGDDHMPHVSAPRMGSTERLVVSPGHEEHALFSMPGGQSGNPFSPFFLSEQDTWATNGAKHLLPGAVSYQLTLMNSK